MWYDNYDPQPHGPYSRPTPPPATNQKRARRWLTRAVGVLLLLALASCFL